MSTDDLGKGGAVVHEATLCCGLAAVARAGIQATLVPASQPWGKPRVRGGCQE